MHNFIAGKMTFLLAFVTTKRNKSDLFFFLAFSTFFRKIEFFFGGNIANRLAVYGRLRSDKKVKLR